MPKFKSISDVIKRLERTIGRSLTAREMRSAGVSLVSTIRKRTRDGYGVPKTFRKRKKLRALSARYIEFRRGFAGLDTTTTNPNKSNLTLTGEMLRTFKVITATDQTVTLGFSNQRAANKARWTQRAGRVWVNVSDEEAKGLADHFERKLSKALKAQRL